MTLDARIDSIRRMLRSRKTLVQLEEASSGSNRQVPLPSLTVQQIEALQPIAAQLPADIAKQLADAKAALALVAPNDPRKSRERDRDRKSKPFQTANRKHPTKPPTPPAGGGNGVVIPRDADGRVLRWVEGMSSSV